MKKGYWELKINMGQEKYKSDIKIQELEVSDLFKLLSIESPILLKNKGITLGMLNPESNFKTVRVMDLVKEKKIYFVPAYQRGYRWGVEQVEHLLQDIMDWESEEKYSLQPIVIKENEDGHTDLIDGQQRMTTIYLILKAINQDVLYRIDYETRSENKEFLDNITGHLDDFEKNIDYFHFIQTYNTAKKFFEKHDKEKWLKHLENAIFIQYNATTDNRDDEAIFTGLNAGKIPLTLAELVKGRFLKTKNFDSDYPNGLIEISTEWDRIERRLHEPNFWSWLGQKEDKAPRIDLVLNRFDEKMFEHIDKDNVKELWRKFRNEFMKLEDWYDDFEMYHIVGYSNVINKKSNVRNKKSKDDISKISKPNLTTMKFGDSEVFDALLLFNILSCIESKTIRFDFERYLDADGYDVEHIFPHSEFERLQNITEKEKWYKEIKDSHLFDDVLPSEFVVDDFEEIYDNVINIGLGGKRFDDVNRIGNLCLLDKKTNRGYGNKPFPFKVQEIMKYDSENSRYILPTTKNAFLKYYSGLNINNFIWTNEDADKYEEKMNAIFDKYLAEENNEQFCKIYN